MRPGRGLRGRRGHHTDRHRDLQAGLHGALHERGGEGVEVAVEFARKLLFSDVRPTFSDLEGHLKGKKQ